MKLFVILLLGLVFLASANQSFAYTTYYDYDNGSGYGTSNTYGNTSYYDDFYGTTGTLNSYGDSYYYNYSNPYYGTISGSARSYGNSTYYDGDIYGSSHTYGNTTYYNLDGENYSCRVSGSYTYCN